MRQTILHYLAQKNVKEVTRLPFLDNDNFKKRLVLTYRDSRMNSCTMYEPEVRGT